MNQGFLFDTAQFNRLFPFYIKIDRELKVSAMGQSVQKICAVHAGDDLRSIFHIPRPHTPIHAFADLQKLQHQLIVLEHVQDQHIKLRGQLEFLTATGEMLFVGSPWFGSMDQVKENNLHITDFAFHDPLIDLLHVLKAQEISNEDLKKLAKNFSKQKEELKKANKEVHDIALFPTQNPDPHIRINFAGDVLLNNPAAASLDFFDYNGSTLRNDLFFKLIADSIDKAATQWTFEATSGNKTFSFLCVTMREEGYINIYGRDITEKKKTENQLARLSLVASANKNGVLFCDPAGKITWANEGFCTLTGFALHEVIGKSPYDLCKGPLSDSTALNELLYAFYKGEQFNRDVIYYRKDKSWFWGQSFGQPLRNKEGVITEYFGIIQDITTQKESEEKLKVLSQIAEDNINAVIMADQEGKITWVNKSFTAMTGYALEEVLGKKPGHFLQGPETDPQAVQYLSSQINKGESFSTEILNYNKAGEKYWLRIQGQPIKNDRNELIGFFALEEDITKGKAAEIKFRKALESIGDNVWEHDFKTNTTYFSKSDNQFLGYATNASTNNQQMWWEGVHEEDRHLLVENDQKYQSGQADSHNLEYRVVHQDGSIKWVLDRGVVIEKDANGKPLRITGTHTDITSIKHIETELANRVKQFQSLSENIPGVIYEFEFKKDGTDSIRYISPAIEKLFGISPEQFKNYLAYIHPDDRQIILERNLHSRKTLAPFYAETRLLVPGQPMRWHSVHSSFSYHTPNGDSVFTGFMLDITERKKSEIALQENEEKYRSIIANMNLGLMEMDKDGIIDFANQTLLNMAGLTNAIGYNSMQFLAPESLEKVKGKMHQRERGESDAYEVKININGKEGWWFVSSAPKYAADGNHVGSIVICLDITNQKQLEVDLIEAREQAEGLAKAKETFLANMSHEIRTPMNAIIGMGNQLAKTTLNQQQQFYLNTIKTAAENLLVIINDILDLSKIDAGKLTVENIVFEPKKVIENAQQVLLHKAEEKGLKLTISFFDPRTAEALLGDPYRLNQVLLNLISNAVKFTEKGTVDIVCEVLEDSPQAQTLRTSVIDTGIGIEKEFVEKLFDKFSQEYDSVTRKYGGTGLGMSICKELVELMGGTIAVKSQKGKGTTVFFDVPFNKTAKTDLPMARTSVVTDDVLKGKTILVTDDNDMNRLVASTILEGYGAKVVEAANGQEAIAYVLAAPPDLILMDIQMPVLNGFDATRQLRKLGIDLPVIALTANAIRGENQKCLAAGMDDYIAKPFDEQLFIKMIVHWLQTGRKIEPESVSKQDNDKTPTQLYDLSALEAISRGNDGFIIKMLQLFVEQGPATVNDMKKAYAANDFEKIKQLAHRLKPSLDSMGIFGIKNEIREIELEALNLGHSEALAQLLSKVDDVLSAAVVQLRAYLAAQTRKM